MKQDPKEMQSERFRALAMAYGANIARWPAAERQAAEAFLARSPDAARWLDEQRQLDDRLDSVDRAEPSAELLRRVAEIPLYHGKHRQAQAWWPFVRLRAAVALAAAAAVTGAAVGVITPDRTHASEVDRSWEDLSGLAFALDLSEELSP